MGRGHGQGARHPGRPHGCGQLGGVQPGRHAGGHGVLDKTARLWDAATGKALATLDGHTDRSSRRRSARTARGWSRRPYDKTARLWDAATGKALATLEGHTDAVNSAAFSPDGTRVVTASDDQTAKIWRVFPTTQELIDYARSIMPRQLTPEQRKQFFLEAE